MSVGYRAAQVIAFMSAGAMGLFLLRGSLIDRPVEFGMYLLLMMPYVYLYYSRGGGE